MKKSACILSITGLVLLNSMLAGCGEAPKTFTFIQKEESKYEDLAKKENGEAFTIALMDEAPPIESSYLWLKGMCEELQKMGYIKETVDLENAPKDYEGYFRYITSQDLGDIVIDSEMYLLSEENMEEIGQNLREKAEKGDLDLIAVTGTYPGTFLKELDLPIPFLVSFASDPVGSGIIESTSQTGGDNVWALVESGAFERQLETYSLVYDMKRVGVISAEELWDIDGSGEYDREAEVLGIELVREYVAYDDLFTDSAKDILEAKVRTLVEKGVDGIVFLYGVFDETNVIPEDILDAAKDTSTPILISDGDVHVTNGGLVLISFFNYEGYGRHIATVMNNIFHGEKASEQAIVYESTPRIVYNITTAQKLGVDSSYDFLQAADVIYK